MSVIAIEAVPEKPSDLARRFPNAEVHGCVVGETNGEARFFVDGLRPGFSTLSETTGVREHSREILAPLRRPDDSIPATTKVEIVTIDVKGCNGRHDNSPRVDEQRSMQDGFRMAGQYPDAAAFLAAG